MCTVSFYSDSHKTIITSNRDERKSRKLALPPSKKVWDEKVVYYPTDPEANGTWFGVKANGSFLVLLNGAEKKHVPNPPYRKSRGLILVDLLTTDSFLETWKSIELEDIEPFTLIAFEKKELFQFRWNGRLKTKIKLATHRPYIWSSSTLYDAQIIALREKWFFEFLKKHNFTISDSDLLHFHTDAQKTNHKNGLIINRDDEMLTKNVTQCVIEKEQFSIKHLDLIMNKKTVLKEKINEIVLT